MVDFSGGDPGWYVALLQPKNWLSVGVLGPGGREGISSRVTQELASANAVTCVVQSSEICRGA